MWGGICHDRQACHRQPVGRHLGRERREDAARTADGAATSGPHIHQCTLAPVSNFAINTKGTGAQSGRSPIAEITVTRIDLQVSASPGGSASPTITAHAINTKGTGVNSGRISSEVKVKNQLPIGIDCVSSQWTGDAAAQTKEVLARIRKTLDAAGYTPADVVDSLVYLTDLEQFQSMNAEYRAFFGKEFPARTTVGTGLVAGGAVVEILMTAAK